MLRTTFALALLCGFRVTAQDSAAVNAPTPPQVDKRILGVLPNNRTTEMSIPFKTITTRQKLTIAYKDSTDYPVYPTAALFASVYQLTNQNPSFGQGMAGYARRLGTAYGDQVAGNMMTEGIMPSLLREDPRYFRLGEGTAKHRIWYAVTRIFVTRMDSGRWGFNFAEIAGNASAAAISNAWYSDSRNAKDNANKLAISCGTDALSNLLKEFWPDLKRRHERKREQ
jgi:hypothetical protein